MPALAAAVVEAATTYLGTLTVTGIITSLATSIILGGLQQLLMPKPKSSGVSGITNQVKQSLVSRKLIYGGTIRTSGAVVLITTTNLGSTANYYLHLIVALASNELSEIGEIWLNDYPICSDILDANGNVISGRYNGYVRIKKHLGGAGQVADPDLLAEIPNWTSQHVLSGVAYVYVRLKYSASIYPTGVPNISAFVKGKPLYDPRTLTTGFSNNLALIIADYLQDANFGMGADSTEIDQTFLQASANSCDEWITAAAVVMNSGISNTLITPTPNPTVIDVTNDAIQLVGDALLFFLGDRVRLTTTGTLPGGLALNTDYYVIPFQQRTTIRVRLASSYANALAGTYIDITSTGSGTVTITKTAEPRFTGAIEIDTATAVGDNINNLLSGMVGRLVYSGGAFRIMAGVYQTPTVYFDEDDLAGPMSVQTKVSRRERFNAVMGAYLSPINDGQPTNYPQVKNSFYATNDGEYIIQNVDFPTTFRPGNCQRNAKIVLEQSRQEITWSADFKLSAFLVCGGDNAFFSNTRLGWTNKIFTIQSWKFEIRDQNGTPVPVINMTLRETASANFDWNNGEETTVDPAPNTNLPEVFTVQPPGAPMVAESLYMAGPNLVSTEALLTCDPSPDAFVASYQFRYKLDSDSVYIERSPVTSPADTIFGIPSGTYDFSSRAINQSGVASDWVDTVIQIVGLNNTPAQLTNLSIQSISNFAILTWDLSPDLDVQVGGNILFRWTPTIGAGVDWSTSTTIGNAVAGNVTQVVLPLLAGTYLARAVDSSGIPGPVTIVTTNAATAITYAPLTSITEDPVFAGSMTNVVRDPDQSPAVIKLCGTTLFDSWPSVDAVTWWDSNGGVQPSGTYGFSAGIDLGSVKQTLVTTHILARVVNVNDLFDLRTGLVDSWADWDGSVTGDGDAQIWARTTNDDPAGSPTWGSWNRLSVGNFNCRAFQFECLMFSLDPAYNIYVQELSVNISTA